MKNFIIKLTIVTVAVAVIGGIVFSLLLPQYYLPVFPYLLVFFYFITLALHAYQLNLIKKDEGRFMRSNMLLTFFKLLIYSVAAIVYIALDKANAVPFVIVLLVLYLIFTFLEVSELSRITRKARK